MKEKEKTKNDTVQKEDLYDDILSFEYYNYRLENLAKEIRRKPLNGNLKLARKIS